MSQRSQIDTNWPNDADGDAIRRIWHDNVNFNIVHTVDFQIDFSHWPPVQIALDILKEKYGISTVVPPEKDDCGYVEVSIRMKIDYDKIVRIQKVLTNLVSSYGGNCECWGLMTD